MSFLAIPPALAHAEETAMMGGSNHMTSMASMMGGGSAMPTFFWMTWLIILINLVLLGIFLFRKIVKP